MPTWLIQLLLETLSKYLTPEVVAELEAKAKQAFCCELQVLAKNPNVEHILTPQVVGAVAHALGADLSKCAA